MNELPKILIDSREQTPLEFPGYETEGASLTAGDYSLYGLKELVAIERKALPDLVRCCTNSERDRFKRELHRLQAYRCKGVVIEACFQDALQGNYKSQLNPNALIASVSSWQLKYNVPFIWAGTPDGAARATIELLTQFFKQCQKFAKILNKEGIK